MPSDDHSLFVVSKEDWSLHRKGYQDQVRHQEKVKEIIKQNLPDLITEENIVMSDGKQIIKVPIRSLDEYRFIYNYQKQKHVGQGDGDSQVGDVLGRDPVQKPGQGEKAGDQPGQDIMEAEISLEDLENMLFDQLELPNMKPKEQQEVETESITFNDIRKKACSPTSTRSGRSWKICGATPPAASREFIISAPTICATKRGRTSSFPIPARSSLR